MPGRVAHALIRKQIETYHAQGLPEEALHLVDATLRSNPDLPEHMRAGFEAQVRRFRLELADAAPDEQAAVSDEQLEVIRRGWDGSDGLEDHLECARGLYTLGRYPEALEELRAAVAKGLPLRRALAQMSDCLSGAFAPEAIADATARLALGLFSKPDGAFGLELALAETMAAGGRSEHASALARSLVGAAHVPVPYRSRLAVLAERLLVAPVSPPPRSFFRRLLERLQSTN